MPLVDPHPTDPQYPPQIIVVGGPYRRITDYMRRHHPQHPRRDTVVIMNWEMAYRVNGMEFREGVDRLIEIGTIPHHHAEIVALVKTRFRR